MPNKYQALSVGMNDQELREHALAEAKICFGDVYMSIEEGYEVWQNSLWEVDQALGRDDEKRFVAHINVIVYKDDEYEPVI